MGALATGAIRLHDPWAMGPSSHRELGHGSFGLGEHQVRAHNWGHHAEEVCPLRPCCAVLTPLGTQKGQPVGEGMGSPPPREMLPQSSSPARSPLPITPALPTLPLSHPSTHSPSPVTSLHPHSPHTQSVSSSPVPSPRSYSRQNYIKAAKNKNRLKRQQVGPSPSDRGQEKKKDSRCGRKGSRSLM